MKFSECKIVYKHLISSSFSSGNRTLRISSPKWSGIFVCIYFHRFPIPTIKKQSTNRNGDKCCGLYSIEQFQIDRNLWILKCFVFTLIWLVLVSYVFSDDDYKQLFPLNTLQLNARFAQSWLSCATAMKLAVRLTTSIMQIDSENRISFWC